MVEPVEMGRKRLSWALIYIYINQLDRDVLLDLGDVLGQRMLT